MCKKLLSGLFGGGKQPDIPTPATPAVNAPANTQTADVKKTGGFDGSIIKPIRSRKEAIERASVPGLGL